MRRAVCYWLFVSVVCALVVVWSPAAVAGKEGPSMSCPEDKSGLYDKAVEMWSGSHSRESKFKVKELLEKHVAACPRNEDGWVLLSYVYWMIGDALPRGQKEERMSWFAKGEAAADKALALNKDSAGALYWKTTNMASTADMKGWMSSMWMFPTLWDNMEKVEELKPHYFYGGVDRFWCEVLNRVPLFLAERFGHSVEDAIADIEEEIKREPRFFANYVYAARLYNKNGNEERALELLEHVLTTDPNVFPQEKADNEDQIPEAKKLWKEITGEEYPER